MKLTLSNKEVNQMFESMTRIDNTGQAKGSETAKPLVFNGKVLYTLSRNLRKLRSVAEDIGKARNAIIERLVAEQRKDPDPNVAKLDSLPPASDNKYTKVFVTEFQAVLDMEVDVDLFQLKFSDLDLDKNSNFPMMVLTDLQPIIVDDSETTAAPK